MHGRVAHILHDGGQEVRQAGEGVVAGEVDRCVDVVLIVSKTGENLCPLDASLACTVSNLKSLDRMSLFFVGEIFRGTWRVGEAVPDNWGEEDRWGSLWAGVSSRITNEVLTILPMMNR